MKYAWPRCCAGTVKVYTPFAGTEAESAKRPSAPMRQTVNQAPCASHCKVTLPPGSIWLGSAVKKVMEKAGLLVEVGVKTGGNGRAVAVGGMKVGKVGVGEKVLSVGGKALGVGRTGVSDAIGEAVLVSGGVSVRRRGVGECVAKAAVAVDTGQVGGSEIGGTVGGVVWQAASKPPTSSKKMTRADIATSFGTSIALTAKSPCKSDELRPDTPIK